MIFQMKNLSKMNNAKKGNKLLSLTIFAFYSFAPVRFAAAIDR